MKMTQRLYSQNQSRCAEEILSGYWRNGTAAPTTLTNMEEPWRRNMQTPSKEDQCMPESRQPRRLVARRASNGRNRPSRFKNHFKIVCWP